MKMVKVMILNILLISILYVTYISETVVFVPFPIRLV